jgi:hypothetical protein
MPSTKSLSHLKYEETLSEGNLSLRTGYVCNLV